MEEILSQSKISNTDYEDLVSKSLNLDTKKEKSIVDGTIVAIENDALPYALLCKHPPRMPGELRAAADGAVSLDTRPTMLCRCMLLHVLFSQTANYPAWLQGLCVDALGRAATWHNMSSTDDGNSGLK